MTTWRLDPAHTQITFSAKHMMVTTVRGTFHDVEGTIELDEAEPTRSRGEFRVKAASVDTNFGARDAHLRSNDLLGTERFPEIRFESSRIEHVAGTRHVIAGELTVKEVAIPVVLEAKFQGTGEDVYGVEKTLFRVQGEIEWGPTRVEITADITAVRQ